ncbi:GntR family transcriptional regulator [Candidatus Agathobaculum pullicola]|uniref:GntR family transcriptional regulator n=1 Tax=Candidatus Agathobaculum pullicola TaxID=2838426 RepID=UPI003F93414F
MPKAKYEQLYYILKEKIESGTYPPQEMLPSEHTLIAELGCSRNTLRRAVSELVREGYVQTVQGKGMRNIFEPTQQTTFTLGTIETFGESTMRNQQRGTSRVLLFSPVIADRQLADKTGFAEGTQLFYIQRLHYLSGRPLILNHSYFRQDVAKGLTHEIAEGSIYRYLENELHISIINSKRVVTVEKATPLDLQYLDMGDCNCLAVVSSQTYNSDGVMFEYTQSRHQPNFFRFQDNAVRRPSAYSRGKLGGTNEKKE